MRPDGSRLGAELVPVFIQGLPCSCRPEDISHRQIALRARRPAFAGDHVLYLGNALRGQRMRPEVPSQRLLGHARQFLLRRLCPGFILLVQPPEGFEHADGTIGRISRFHCQPRALAVRLQFLILAVSCLEHGDGQRRRRRSLPSHLVLNRGDYTSARASARCIAARTMESGLWLNSCSTLWLRCRPGLAPCLAASRSTFRTKIVLILRSSAGINNVTRSRPSYGRAAIVGASFLTFAIYVKSALMSWFPLELFKFFGPVGLLRYSKIS